MYSTSVESTNQPYLFPEAQASQSLASAGPAARAPRERELATSRVLLHVFLLSVTVATTTLTGAGMSVETGEPGSILGALLAPVLAVFKETLQGNLAPLTNGLLFSFTLLTILGAHELGHYFACRYYGIRATLPFFIPAPPVITPFGTLGAVIKIKEPITTRRALFDIGIAGPLAGFAFALPASIVGLWFAKSAPPPAGGGLQFNDPLLFKVVMGLAGLPHWIEWNPIYWAAWGALLVTALNLFPVGQLDGGHVAYAVAGPRLHRWISRITCASVAALAVISIVMYGSPVWLLWTLVLLFLLRAGHPPVIEEEPLGAARIILAVVAAVVFLLCFMPFPITVS
ncbi:MAG TPA: site-2 protease family protein [Blastocatellia bacterium]|jgi:membrane-associated protease RseP (regulator of RpoE activity)|nr:site-2 protease family protein [Blastocatellia bacterium]